jgi:hypothetical protein
MKRSLPLLVALSGFLVCTGFAPQRVDGLWLPDHPNWQKFPYGDPNLHQTENVAQMALLYFGENGKFALLEGTVNRKPHDFIAISQGDPQTVYAGRWTGVDHGFARYRLVSATEAEGQMLPKVERIVTFSFRADGHIIVDGKSYQRAGRELDYAFRRTLKKVPEAQIAN